MLRLALLSLISVLSSGFIVQSTLNRTSGCSDGVLVMAPNGKSTREFFVEPNEQLTIHVLAWACPVRPGFVRAEVLEIAGSDPAGPGTVVSTAILEKGQTFDNTQTTSSWYRVQTTCVHPYIPCFARFHVCIVPASGATTAPSTAPSTADA